MKRSLEELKAWSKELKDSKGGRKKFSLEFKSAVVKFNHENSIPAARICSELGITPSQFYLWKKNCQAESGNFIELEPTNRSKAHAARGEEKSELRIVSPAGFSLEGDFGSICKAWEALHASSSR